LSADIIRLCDRRVPEADDLTIDLLTAVDVAIRDLREIRACWDSDIARQRLSECELLLTRAFAEA
jgi:hypothetical protein